MKGDPGPAEQLMTDVDGTLHRVTHASDPKTVCKRNKYRKGLTWAPSTHRDRCKVCWRNDH